MLHALAQGGAIHHIRSETGRAIVEVDCFNRDGYRLDDCTLAIFARLKRKRLIESRGGSPYRISRRGILTVRAQLDNR